MHPNHVKTMVLLMAAARDESMLGTRTLIQDVEYLIVLNSTTRVLVCGDWLELSADRTRITGTGGPYGGAVSAIMACGVGERGHPGQACLVRTW